MKCIKFRWLMMVATAIVCVASAKSALALSANPYQLTNADLHSGGNSTDANNLSSIDLITNAADGVHLDVTWRLGQDQDVFADFYGQSFARIGFTVYTNNDDGGLGRLMSPPYDGVRWIIKSDLALQNGQPYQQTPPDWVFYESNYGQSIPAGMVATPITLDYDAAQNFSGLTPAGIVHPNAMGEIRANALGIQIVGPAGLVLGQEVKGHIWICGVPEPTTALTLVLGAIGLVGGIRRRVG